MARSYLMIEENNFQIYRDPHLLEADALIIDVYDASCIFSNYDKLYDLLTEIKQHGTKLYLKLDPHHLNRCYKALDLTLGHYLSGFYIEHPTIRDLNRFHLKIREYEQKNRLEFESLSMIVGIKEAKDVIHLNKIVAHPRVKAIVIDPIPKVDMDYVTEKATRLTTLYKKELLNRSQITMKITDVAQINQAMASVSIPLGATINMAGAAVTITVLTLATVNTLGIHIDLSMMLILSIVAAVSACGASGVAGGSLLLIPVACSLFGISSEIAMQVVAIGMIISVLQDSTETALNSSTDVLFTAAVDFRNRQKHHRKQPQCPDRRNRQQG